jgi:ubiquinone/menaquinone biosynthesis C-methylase UbiE
VENINKILQFYESYDEDERITIRHPLEFIRTKELISRHLPQRPIKIIDLCGATGHYSYWLAEKGHEVHLKDLSPKHIQAAKNYEKKYTAKLASISLGDSRKIDFENETFDMVLLMGALYHLQEKKDRILCIKEANRVLKNNGIAIFAYISRYAPMLDGFVSGNINDPVFRECMENNMFTGNSYPKDSFPAYFHSTSDIYDELLSANFSDIMLYAVEGFSGIIDCSKYLDNNDSKEMLLKYLRLTEQNIGMLEISMHKLAICKKII